MIEMEGKNMSKKVNRLIITGLNIFASGLFGLTIFYWIQVISQDLWDELPMRIIIMVLTIGSVCCFALAKVLRNQIEILKHLTDKK